MRSASSRRCAASRVSRTRRSAGAQQPTLLISAHRAFALGAALTESDIANNTLPTLSGSGQVAPTYWLDRKTGVAHLVNLQTPQAQLTSMSDLETIPIDQGDGDPTGRAHRFSEASPDHPNWTGARGSHRDILPVIDIYASNEGRDLGAVSDAIGRCARADEEARCRTAPSCKCRARRVTMKSAYVRNS
jgi:hypothetical protein